MKRVMSMLIIAAAVISSLLVGGGVSNAHDSTPPAERTSSTQAGYVKSPLPGEILASDNTLEMTFLAVAAGDSTGAYTHPGAAIYYVQSGDVELTVSATDSAIVAAMTGDPSVEAPAMSCEQGCSVALLSGQWLSINSPAELQLDSSSGAFVVIVSLTQESDWVQITTSAESDVSITGDSNVP